MEEKKISAKQKARDERIRQRKELRKIQQELLKSIECSICHDQIEGFRLSADFEPKRINDKQVCDSCWFERVGEEIEQHPIGGFPGR